MAHTDSGLVQDTYSGKLLMMPESFANDCVLVDAMKMMFVARSSRDKCHKYAFLHQTGWVVIAYQNVQNFIKALDEQEARLLYQNTMQKAYSGDARSLYSALQSICDKIPVLQWNTLQLNSGVRRYIDESTSRRAAAASARPAPAPAMPFPAPVRAASAPQTGAPARGSAPARPKAGSTTGRVWDICDSRLSAVKSVEDWKAFKKAVLAIGASEGINESTCSVQFGKWRLSLGI